MIMNMRNIIRNEYGALRMWVVVSLTLGGLVVAPIVASHVACLHGFFC